MNNVILFPGCEEITPPKIVRVPRGIISIEFLPVEEVRRVEKRIEAYAERIRAETRSHYPDGFQYWCMAQVIYGFHEDRRNHTGRPGLSVGLKGETVHVVLKLNELPE